MTNNFSSFSFEKNWGLNGHTGSMNNPANLSNLFLHTDQRPIYRGFVHLVFVKRLEESQYYLLYYGTEEVSLCNWLSMKQSAFSLVAYLLRRKPNVIYFHLRLSRLFCLSVSFFDPTVFWLEPLRAQGRSPLHAGWRWEAVPEVSLFTHVAYASWWGAGHRSAFSFPVTLKLEEASGFARCWICFLFVVVAVNAALQEQIHMRVTHLSRWRHERSCQPLWRQRAAGSSRFPARTVYADECRQVRSELPVLNLMLTTNFRRLGLQEIITANMKKWVREDTQDQKNFCRLASLICVGLLSDQESGSRVA